ncbi:9364_t:CDS:10 [Entrophospora sp. SA101]|nr:9364_t:CDS:10 [Entrophospora sp. SA101]
MLQSPPLSPLTTNTFHLKTNSNQENFLLDPFLYVNGRRYHNVPTASYFLPNDKQEIERLTLEHIIYHFIWNGNFSSPVNNVLKSSPAKNDKAKVLDIGCGPGHWLLEMAEEYPNANFVGIDISPVFPNDYDSNKPTNVAFLKFDALSENGLPFPDDTFDFVYQKFMVFFIPENKRMKHIEELIRITKPGGWIELMDVDPLPYDTGPISTFFLQSRINRKMLFEIPLLFNQKSELITVHSQERPNPIGSWGGKMLKNIELIVDPLKPYILPGYPSNKTVSNSAHQSKYMIASNLNNVLRSKILDDVLIKVPSILEETIPHISEETLVFLAVSFKECENNKTRRCILKVFKEAENHITNNTGPKYEEIIKSIFFLLENQSNDPIARSLALRTLGYISTLLTELLDIQHGILQRLDSPIPIEANAAIFAADKISSKTEKFSVILCEKLASKLQFLRHMHWDKNLARKARSMCIQLLEKHSDDVYVITILKTLTFLSCHALEYTASQIDLLFQYLMDDARKRVKISILTDLNRLASKNFRFDATNILNLLNIIDSESDDIIKIKALNVLSTLLQQNPGQLTNLISIDLDQDVRIEILHYIQIFEDMLPNIQQNMLDLTIVFVRFFVRLIIEYEHIRDLDQFIKIGDEWDIYLKDLPSKISKSILLIIKKLMKASYNTQVTNDIDKKLLKCLFSICLTNDDLAKNVICDIFDLLKENIGHDRLLAKTALRSRPEFTSQIKEFSNTLLKAIHQFGNYITKRFTKNQWDVYLIGVEAGKSGCYNIMSSIFQSFVDEVDSEAPRFWLKSLSNVADAEQKIAHNIDINPFDDGNFNEPVRLYVKGDSELNGFMSFTDTSDHRIFARWFCQLRVEFFLKVKLILSRLNFLLKIKSQEIDFDIIQPKKILNDLANLHSFVAYSFYDIDKESFEILESYPLGFFKEKNETDKIQEINSYKRKKNKTQSVLRFQCIDILKRVKQLQGIKDTVWLKIPSIERNQLFQRNFTKLVLNFEGLVEISKLSKGRL